MTRPVARVVPGAGVLLALGLAFVMAPAAHPRGDRDRAVDVTIKGPSGKVASFVVRIVAGERRSHMVVNTGATGPVLVPGGEATLTVFGARDAKDRPLGWAPATVTVAPGQGDALVRTVAGQRLKGKVRLLDGSPATGATVLAHPAGEQDPRPPWAISSATTAKDGAFELTGLGPEPIDVRAVESVHDSMPTPTLVQKGTKEVALTLVPAVPRGLRIVDEAGRPVEGAGVTLMRYATAPPPATGRGKVGESVVIETTGADGLVRTPRLAQNADLSLRVQPPKDREDLAPLDVDPWPPKDGDVVLPSAFTATIRVVDEEGRPVDAEVIRFTPRTDPDFHLPAWKAVPAPGADGRIVVRRVRAAGERFLATSRTRPPPRKARSPDDRTPEELERFMPPPEFLSEARGEGVFPKCSRWTWVKADAPHLTIVRPTRGNPMRVVAKGARARTHRVILVADLDGAVAACTQYFDTDDVTTLPDIAPGAYRVFVLGPPDADGPAGRTDVPAFREGEVAVALVPSVPLIVTCENKDVGSLGGSVYHDGMPFLTLQADGPARVLARGLPPGTYPVRVWTERAEEEAKNESRPYLDAKVHVETGVEAKVTLTSR